VQWGGTEAMRIRTVIIIVVVVAIASYLYGYWRSGGGRCDICKGKTGLASLLRKVNERFSRSDERETGEEALEVEKEEERTKREAWKEGRSPKVVDLKRKGTFKYEERCREIFEKVFEREFRKVRPDFLRNVTGRNLELDGYNEELGIAFEYHGKQHREFPNVFHTTIEEHEAQRARDRLKRKRCRELGVELIEIPDTVPYTELYAYIVEQLAQRKLVEIAD
jgi:hypothetical protein